MQGLADQKNQVDGKIEKGHFLQSEEWEEFQRSLGREVFRVNDILIIKLPLAFEKSYLYCAGFSEAAKVLAIFAPRKGETSSTPLLYEANDSPLKSQKRLTPFAENAVFLKFEPMIDDGDGLAQELLGSGFKKSKKEVQPQKTIILDLTGSEEELLAGMKQKTRYNSRLASRSSKFKCQISNQTTDASVFWELIRKTAQRDRFSTHTKEYYEKLLDLPITKLFTAECQGEVIAANIILFYGDTAYYLHGASDYAHRNLMAPYLLHWEAIKYAKANGCKIYDFWGIDERKWPGVTRFKRGFGGREINYIGSFDYVFQPLWYWAYNLRNKIKNRR